MSKLMTNDSFDIEAFLDVENDRYIRYQIPKGISFDIESVKSSLLENYRDVEIEIKRDSAFYWIKLFKK